jgi:hypothetical protein
MHRRAVFREFRRARDAYVSKRTAMLVHACIQAGACAILSPSVAVHKASAPEPKSRS